LDYASEWMEPPAGDAPARWLYKSHPQAAAWRQNGRNPECCPRRSWLMKPAWALARLRNGSLTRSCTGLIRLPSEGIADNALRAEPIGARVR